MKKLIIYFCFFIATFFLVSQVSFGQELRLTISTGHLGKVQHLAITNDAKILATASEDAAVKIWNIDDERLIHSYYPHKVGVTTLCFSVDNSYLATAGMDGVVKIIDINNKEEVYSFKHTGGEVFKMKFVAGFLLFITKDGEIYRLDWKNKQLAPDGIKTKISFGNFSSMNYSFKMNWLAVGKMEGDLIIWRGYDRPVVEKNNLHTDWISAVDYIPKDSLIVTSSWDKSIKIWDINADTIVTQMQSPDNTPIVDLKYSSYFKVLVFETAEKKIYFYKYENGKLTEKPLAVRDDFEKMVFTEDTRFAAFTGKDGTISVWRLEEGNSHVNITIKPVKGHLVEGEINTSNGAIAFITTNGNFYSWEPKEVIVTKQWKAHRKHASALEYLMERNRWVTTGADSLVKIWTDKGTLIDSLKLENEGTTLDIIPLMRNILIGTKGGDVKTWNRVSNKTKTLYQHNGEVVHVISDTDGKKIASIGRDRKLKVYNLDKKEIIFETTVSDVWLNDVDFSEDNKQILVAGKKGVHAWDCENWKEITHTILGEEILEIDFLSKKRQWIFGSRSGAISIWNSDLTQQLHLFDESTIPMVDIMPYYNQNIFFAVRTNTTFEIWNIEKERKMGEIIVTDNGNWVIEHHSGLFDVGRLNMSQLYYVYGTETIDFDQLKDKYWEPGLAYEILQNKKLRKVPPLNDLALFPKINCFERNDKLYVEVIDRGGGVGAVSLYINKKEVISDLTQEGQIEELDGEKYYAVDLENVKLHLIPNQENDISILTSNEAGTLNGRGVKLKYKGKEVELESSPTLYGIVVGVSNYRGRLLDLKYADADAKALYSSLELGSEKLFGMKNTALQLLVTDATEEYLQPNKENIKEAFKKVEARAKASDILLVFLAGHGTVAANEDGANDFHFLTKDMTNSDISDPDIRSNYTISGSELLKWIKDIPISKQVFVVDACHAGSFSTELITSRDYNEEGMKKRALERMRAKTGMFMLSGASADKVSYESSYLEHGLLTYALLDYLKRGELDEGRFVDVQDFFIHAVEAVPELASSMRGEQQPEYRIPVGSESFYIGELAAEEREEIDLSIQKNLLSAIYLEDSDSWADHLNLSEQVKNAFILTAENKELSIKYSKGAKGENTFIIRGKYELNKTSINIKLHIISNNEVLEKWQIKAVSQEEAVKKVVEMINHYFEN